MASASVSTYGTKLEVAAAPGAVLLVFPGCRNVDPAIFFASGTFSFTRVLRVPTSGNAFPAASADSDAGSTNIWSLAFEGALWGSRDAGARGAGTEEVEAAEVVASAVRFVSTAGAGAAGRAAAHIMRFWKSACRALRCSSGEARLAIPNKYASSASFRLHIR